MWGFSTRIFATKYFVSRTDFEMFAYNIDYMQLSFDYVYDTKRKKVLLCFWFSGNQIMYFQMRIRAFEYVLSKFGEHIRFRKVKWICTRNTYRRVV